MRKTKVEGWRVGIKEERRWEREREGARIWVIVVGDGGTGKLRLLQDLET